MKAIDNVAISSDRLEVTLRDGRTISAPLAWFPRLAKADAEARHVWEPSATGLGIHWPLIDEDLSIDGLLRGGGSNGG